MSATLDDVESYINDHPDSALAVLRSVDTTALRTRGLRARYSLLRVMALDKCFEDITRPGLLDPAVNWYERHGSADERKMEKSPPKGLMLSDFSCIFAMSVLTYMSFVVSTNLGEISDNRKPL